MPTKTQATIEDLYRVPENGNAEIVKEQKELRKQLDASRNSQAVAEGQLLELRQESEQNRAQLASMTQEAKEKEKPKPSFGQKLANTFFGSGD